MKPFPQSMVVHCLCLFMEIYLWEYLCKKWVLRYLKLEDSIRELEGIGKVVSVFDFMSTMQDQTRATIDQSLMGEFINPGAKKYKIMVFPTDHENETLRAITFTDSHDCIYLNVGCDGSSVVFSLYITIIT